MGKKIGRPARIDLAELSRMLKSGLSQSECAEKFGVSRASISMAAKKIRGAVTSEVALQAAPAIVAADLRAVEDFNAIHSETLVTLERIKRHLDGSEKMRLSDADALSLALRAVGELRQQARMQMDMVTTLIGYDEVKGFQRTIIEIIFEVCDAKQRRIITDKLRENRLVRRTFRFDSGS